MSAEERGAALDSGMLAIGENVVAVLTFTVAAGGGRGLALEADITARGVSPRVLALALRGVVADLERDKGEPCEVCGKVHD